MCSLDPVLMFSYAFRRSAEFPAGDVKYECNYYFLLKVMKTGALRFRALSSSAVETGAGAEAAAAGAGAGGAGAGAGGAGASAGALATAASASAFFSFSLSAAGAGVTSASVADLGRNTMNTGALRFRAPSSSAAFADAASSGGGGGLDASLDSLASAFADSSPFFSFFFSFFFCSFSLSGDLLFLFGEGSFAFLSFFFFEALRTFRDREGLFFFLDLLR